MMAWVHASVGAFIGGRAGSKKLAFSLGAVSHGILDLFPHRDYELEIEAPLVLGVLGYIGKRYGVNSPELAGALGGISPDVENGLNRLGIGVPMIYPTHTSYKWFVGHGRKIKSPISQIILASLCLLFADRLNRKPKPPG